MPPRVLLCLYLLATLAPLSIAALRDSPPRSIWDELASGAGMLAFAIFLAEFLLSGRFKTVSRRIGMDHTMRLHQLLARGALVLAMLHPFFYRTPSKPPYPWDVTRQLTLTDDFSALASGILAWLLLVPLVLLAIGREHLDYRYEIWRGMHGAGAALIAALVLHHTLSAGRYAQDPVLAGIWVGLFAIASLSLLFVYLGKPLLQALSPWVVEAVRSVGPKTWEVTIAPLRTKGLRYEAGQFVWLNIGHSPLSLFENPFSISSAPSSGDRLQFIIKELGDFSGFVGQIATGTRAHVDGPFGNLVVTGRKESGIALIAGGVGISPLIGILRQLHHDRDPRPTTFVYGNRIEEQIACRQELELLAEEHGTWLVHVLQEPPEGWSGRAGLCDGDLIRAVFDRPEMRDWLFVLCGPPGMMDAVETALFDMGIPASRVLSERFKYD